MKRKSELSCRRGLAVLGSTCRRISCPESFLDGTCQLMTSNASVSGHRSGRRPLRSPRQSTSPSQGFSQSPGELTSLDAQTPEGPTAEGKRQCPLKVLPGECPRSGDPTRDDSNLSHHMRELESGFTEGSSTLCCQLDSSYCSSFPAPSTSRNGHRRSRTEKIIKNWGAALDRFHVVR